MKRNLFLLLWIVVVAICPVVTKGQIVTTIAGNGTGIKSGDGGDALSAGIDTLITSIARDAAGNIYINDQGNHCVRKIDHTTGNITTVAGNGSPGYSGDGGLATDAQLFSNWGIAVDGPGNIYITDRAYPRVRKVNTAGIITTVAGNGTPGKSGDGGLAILAQFTIPMGIALDAAGNIYVNDAGAFNIRKITPTGIISTIAGRSTGIDTAGYSGDGGPATNAKLSYLFGITVDNAGNIYTCDGGDHVGNGNNCIRKIDPAGIITTIAGTGTPGFSGDNGPATAAQLRQPAGVHVDNTGNIFIADVFNHRVRKINTAGVITTIAGNGIDGFNGDGAAAVTTWLSRPLAITGGDSGKIIIGDMHNGRVRVIHKVLSFFKGWQQQIDVCENVSIQLDSLLAVVDRTTTRTDLWTIGTYPVHGSLSVFPFSKASTGGYNLPLGMAYTPDASYIGNDSFIVNVTNGVDTSFTKVYLTVKPKLTYAGIISGPSNLCVGATITLTDTVGNGKWSASNLNAVVTNGIVTGQSAGTVTITYTLNNVCGSVIATKTLTVYALPDAGKISGDSLICIGQTVTLSETIPGGLWSISNANASISSSGLLSGIVAGKDTVRYTISDGTCTNRAIYVVTIDAVPVAQIVTGRTAFCANDTTLISGIPDGGIWVFAQGHASLLGNVITGLTPGDDTVKYIYANHCGIDTATAYITIYPLPSTPAITQNESVIYVPDSFTAYQWILNGSPIPGAQTDSYSITLSGYYAVTVMNRFGCAVTTPQVEYTGCSPEAMSVYPNPAEKKIFIQWCKPVTVRILCMDGKELGINAATYEVDLSGLPNGSYLLTFFDDRGNKIKTKMIIKDDRRY